MAKYTVVKEAPETLEKNEIVIGVPNFLDEIRDNARKAGRGGLTGVNHLRGIVDSVAFRYDPENMSAFSVRPHLFEGRKYSSDEELNAIVVEMFKAEYPNVFQKYVEHHMRKRPKGTTLVYIVDTGLKQVAQIAQDQGLDFIDLTREEKPNKKNNTKASAKSTDNQE